MKRTIKLTETEVRNIIKETVTQALLSKILSESVTTGIENKVVSQYSQELYNTLVKQYNGNEQNGLLTRGTWDDMGFVHDMVNPECESLSEEYGINYEDAYNLLEKAWNNAFDRFESEYGINTDEEWA